MYNILKQSLALLLERWLKLLNNKLEICCQVNKHISAKLLEKII